MEIVAYLRDDNFDWHGFGYPYSRVVALRNDDHIVRENDTMHDATRRLIMSRVVGTRLMTAYQNMCWGFSLNCDFFSRYLAGVSFDPANVTIDKFGSMSKVETIPVGGIGLVNVPDEGVVHSIGYGLGEEGLQALSGQGIVGIADNKAVLNFYSEFYGGDAELYELQLHNGHWSI